MESLFDSVNRDEVPGYESRWPLFEALPSSQRREKPLLFLCGLPFEPPSSPDGKYARAVENSRGLQHFKATGAKKVGKPPGAERDADLIRYDPETTEKPQERAIAQGHQWIYWIIEREDELTRRPKHAYKLFHCHSNVRYRCKMIEG